MNEKDIDETLPKVIYLQLGDEPTTYAEAMRGEVSWCVEKIYEYDVEYVLAAESAATIEALRKEIDAERAISQAIGKLEGATIAQIEQIITDPENQPSQFGTVPLSWYENTQATIAQQAEAIRLKDDILKLAKKITNIPRVVRAIDAAISKDK